ncbi:beta-glucosidase A [Oxobacter pfennigii]|uniref:Beta-glucosidase A n=1 Tax=Oxobacter pfennigii TaxID=36849 RepID=A0A0P8W829_9CLOT|nr:glycoside hydrolase family 1 protein [Oxobacter pfennigii]KPU44181.1 beta-glucosidase A [Oxobacter pfennigii]
MSRYIFPPGFLWGSASSAFQVEGMCTNHDFYLWYKEGRIKDNSNPDFAVLHYIKYKEDFHLLKELSHNTVRIGLEWARIEPIEGSFDILALMHYRNVLKTIKDLKMSPMVTLHHFSIPLWLFEKGGFEYKDCSQYFLRYVKKTVEFLGDLIDFYITINEPTVLAYNGYFTGEFPPGKKDYLLMQKVHNALINIHILSYNCIHRIHESKGWHKAKVSIAKHMREFTPYREKSLMDKLSQKYIDVFFNHSFLNKAMEHNSLDFIGINYYTGSLIKFPFETLSRKDLKKNSLGWDIYPQGFYNVIKITWNKYKLPIYITENGVCDFCDELREDFIREHIKAMHKAIEEGADVRGYYHWSSLDNFELTEGIKIRFGIIHIDHDSPSKTRTIKASGRLYAKIISQNGLLE